MADTPNIPESKKSDFHKKSTVEASNRKNAKRIFISHASKNKAIVSVLINILEAIGVSSSQIFCSSFEGYAVDLGENYIDRLKFELEDTELVFFVLTKEFYDSPICLCEMGAAWIKTNEHIPIMVPPFEFADVKGVFPLTQGMYINDPAKLNSLKAKLEKLFLLPPDSNVNIWERKRALLLDQANQALGATPDSKERNKSAPSNDKNRNDKVRVEGVTKSSVDLESSKGNDITIKGIDTSQIKIKK